MQENQKTGLQITAKAARVNAGFSQKEAANMLEISVSSFQGCESGKTSPPWSVVLRMSALYKISVDNIFLDNKPLKA